MTPEFKGLLLVGAIKGAVVFGVLFLAIAFVMVKFYSCTRIIRDCPCFFCKLVYLIGFHEDKLGFRVNKSLNKPWSCHSVNMHMISSYP